MPRLSIAVLTLAVLGFAAGVLALLVERFETGELYPAGSSRRTDPFGTKALYAALAAQPGLRVQRYEGGPAKLDAASDATLVFTEATLAQLSGQEPLLAHTADGAARRGARVVVLLSEREAMACRLAYCRSRTRPSCGDGAEQPAVPTTQRPKAPCDPQQTASGRWGFAVQGRAASTAPRGRTARLSEGAAASGLPQALPWRPPAFFGHLDPAFRVLFRVGEQPVLVERRLGKGSVVLVAGSFLVTNEGLGNERSPGLLAWLIGPKRRVVFDETHLGVEHRRGVVALARRHGLGGFFIGVALLGLLVLWSARSPWAPAPSPAPSGSTAPEPRAHGGLARLLRRTIPPARLLEACAAEAAGAGSHLGRPLPPGTPAAASSSSQDPVREYNRRLQTHEPGHPST